MAVKIPKAYHVVIAGTVDGKTFKATGVAYGTDLFAALDSFDDVEWDGDDPEAIRAQLRELDDADDPEALVTRLLFDVSEVSA